jgi:hypothetical protein
MRGPLMGYNHNLRYKGRDYHVQTEDSGLQAPHVYTHLFCDGTVLSTQRTEYGDIVEKPDHEALLVKMMRDQHKAVMRELLHGQLDEKIVAIFGGLEKQAKAKVRRYRHKIHYRGRQFSVETTFYAIIVTDIYCEGLLVDSTQLDGRTEDLEPGSDDILKRAQVQHKDALRAVKNGSCDETVIRLFGKLEPNQPQQAAVDPKGLEALARVMSTEVELQPESNAEGLSGRTEEHYHHRLQKDERLFEILTRVYLVADTPHAVSELICSGEVLSVERLERDSSREVRKAARDQHKRMLRDLRDGQYDETIELLEELLEEKDAIL